MKRLISIVLTITLMLSLSACGSTSNGTSGNNTSKTEVLCDINRFANISSADLISLIGEPDDIRDTITNSGFADIPCTYYDYDDIEPLGEVSFILINDSVAQLVSYNDFAYYKGKNVLARFNVDKADTCATAVDSGTSLRYRCLSETIDDFWITDIDTSTDTFGFLKVTYDMMYFEEWYLPMDIREQSDYQYRTQETVKTLLKAPSTAKFPNINDWAIVKNNFYIAAQSYVDAQNSFGAQIRSDFTFIYEANTSNVIYAVFDGDEICNNGYVKTADLVKRLVSETKDSGASVEATDNANNVENNTTEEPKNDSSVDAPVSNTQESNTPIESAQPEETYAETNSISDLEYIVLGVCSDYNSSSNTALHGKLYGTVSSPTSITIEHRIGDLIETDKEYVVHEMENKISNLFTSTLNDAFPEPITVSVYSTYTLIDSSQDEESDLDGVATNLTPEQLAELGITL